MKKFLLSSIIMLGVCGAVNAQSGAKAKKNDLNAAGSSTSATAPTPQKAAIMPASDVAAPATRTAADKEAAANAPAAAKSSSDGATTINAAGEVVPVNNASRKEAKMAAAKAANEKKTGSQN